MFETNKILMLQSGASPKIFVALVKKWEKLSLGPGR
jgi:hypothetical protein